MCTSGFLKLICTYGIFKSFIKYCGIGDHRDHLVMEGDENDFLLLIYFLIKFN